MPYCPMVAKSTLPVKSAMSCDLGSEGLKVPIPTRSSSEIKMRRTGTFSTQPAYRSLTIKRQ